MLMLSCEPGLKKRNRTKYRIKSTLFFVFHVFVAEYHYCGPCYHSNKAQGQAKSVYTDIWLAKARPRPTVDVSTDFLA